MILLSITNHRQKIKNDNKLTNVDFIEKPKASSHNEKNFFLPNAVVMVTLCDLYHLTSLLRRVLNETFPKEKHT